jgi:hypothetical protein
MARDPKTVTADAINTPEITKPEPVVVKITEPAEKQPELSAQTKLEMEAGRAALAARTKR